jgi:hypothetical protein
MVVVRCDNIGIYLAANFSQGQGFIAVNAEIRHKAANFAMIGIDDVPD